MGEVAKGTTMKIAAIEEAMVVGRDIDVMIIPMKRMTMNEDKSTIDEIEEGTETIVAVEEGPEETMTETMMTGVNEEDSTTPIQARNKKPNRNSMTRNEEYRERWLEIL